MDAFNASNGMANELISTAQPEMEISSSGNILDDLYSAVSVRTAALTNHRPVWTITCVVDQISFYIGGFGGVGLAYFMDQYDWRYLRYNEEHSPRSPTPSAVIMDPLAHIITNPFHVAHRFFFSGTLYVLIGIVTNDFVKQNSASRALICGSLTGLYFTFDGTFTQMVKGAAGFAGFSLMMEALTALALAVVR